MAVDKCAECGGELDGSAGFSILSRSLERPTCRQCRRRLRTRFAGALAILGLGVALSPIAVSMPVGLFVALGAGLVLAAGLVYWRARQEEGGPHRAQRAPALPLREGIRNGLPEGEETREGTLDFRPSTPDSGIGWLAGDPKVRFYAAIFGTWFLAYYAANLACGEWNPLLVGCNDTCKGIMWGSLGSMAALSVAYLMGYRKVAWLMLGVMVLQNYPHCQCENGFYIPALRVQPFCLIVPTLVGLTNLWLLRIGRHKPIGFALTLSLLAGAFAVAVTHRLGIPISWR